MSTKYSKLARFFNRVLYIGSAAMMLAALVLTLSPQPVAAAGNPGAIWTTNSDCSVVSQDVNHYSVGQHVYIHFKDFNPGTYSWQIQQVSGNPKPIVASGSQVVGSSGAGCFDAYTVQPGDAGNEYSVNFGRKNDNYRVNTPASPTATPTTPEPTATGEVTKTDEPTATPVVSSTPEGEPTDQPTVSPTSRPKRHPTLTPTATPVIDLLIPVTGNPTQTPTPVLDPLIIQVDPYCSIDGKIQWTLENPNSVSVHVNSFTLDGGTAQSGFLATPGSTKLILTDLGTHKVVVSYGQAQTTSLSYTLDVCPLQIPVTGSDLLIPVTGADLSGQLGSGFFFGSLAFAGLGMVLSSLRKFLNF